ncbi:MAG: tRNA (guanosine(46)-N7)-methyltransferase TrmB [Clostridiales bacterium]|nr:tRNA (guanosine(46)-N7)-methyltransferase TrmB [Clostridiales bacterium]
MRIRKKNWTEEELETSKYLINEPESLKGRWKERFGNDNPIHIEIGCGKGRFVSEMSKLTPGVNYVGIEKFTMVVSRALRKCKLAEAGGNVFITCKDAEEIENVFEKGEVKRIYLNFSDPWPNRKKWIKKRLTNEKFLERYENIFGEKGEVFLKTDNRKFFEYSLQSFSEKGWVLRNISLDLHNSGFEGNVMTEYEKKFSEQGMPIYRLEAYFENKAE